jgi:hypothetical protein
MMNMTKTSDTAGFPRWSLAYWLIEVEGIDGRTAARIIAMDKQGIDPRPHFPSDAEKIQSAYDGRYCVQNDC